MQTKLINWCNTPLFHAATNVINTSTQKLTALSCAVGYTPRMNVGNLHEIKRYWQQTDTPVRDPQ
jgi:hypothetical protein